MGHLHDSWKGSPSAIVPDRNARGQAVPTCNGSMDAAYADSEAKRLAEQLSAARAARAAKAMCQEKAVETFGEQVTLYAPLHVWELEGSITRWRVTCGRDTIGFVAEFADHVEAWSVSGYKPDQRIG